MCPQGSSTVDRHSAIAAQKEITIYYCQKVTTLPPSPFSEECSTENHRSPYTREGGKHESVSWAKAKEMWGREPAERLQVNWVIVLMANKAKAAFSSLKGREKGLSFSPDLFLLSFLSITNT